MLLKEWEMYGSRFPNNPIIKDLHLGCGTPAFLSPESLELLINGLLKETVVPKDRSFCFEAHP
jgi:oxygen-independent coproporphyrinogen-3 oxidase